jgi:hypothetical protein
MTKQNGHVKGNAGSSSCSASSAQASSSEGAQGSSFPSEERAKPVQNGSTAFVEDQHKGCNQPAGPEAAERRKKSEWSISCGAASVQRLGRCSELKC